MSNEKNAPFFDSKLIIVIVLVTTFWILWQSYMKKKYPDAYKAPVVSEKLASPTDKVGGTSSTPTAESSAQNDKPNSEIISSGESPAQKEETIRYTDQNMSFDLTSKGMGVRNVNLHKYTARGGEPAVIAKENDSVLFATGLNGQRSPIDFKIEQTSENQFMGQAQLGNMKITKLIDVDPRNYSLRSKVRVENANDNFTGLVTQTVEEVLHYEKGFFLLPQFEHQEFYVVSEGSSSREILRTDENFTKSYSKVNVAAFGSQYFASAIVDKSPVMPDFLASAEKNGNKSYGRLTYNVLNRADNFAIEYLGFVGPKSYDLVKSIDPELTGLINLGFFTSIAKAVLWLMKTIHAVVGNWGLAIILLTIFVRILVLPFNFMSFKSMKALSAIQPQMKIIRERYKDDPNTMNQEIMKLMKEAKANPLSGCLPMFLQMPVFFALYQVIGQSIELYKAPFVFWITDLSLKDPFYILPILMAVTMFLQQKMTPTTMEPAQQKVMLFMPVLFSLLMLTLPSALTLYIFVSAVFGVIQQIYFMKSNKMAVLTPAQ